MRQRLAVFFATLVVTVGLIGSSGTGIASAGPPPARAEAEIFATSNRAIITDPNDPRLKTRLVAFDVEVRATIRANGANPHPSTLLNGVFWSTDLRKATYERSRQFPITRTSTAGLHHIAAVVRKRFQQESVLTFEHLAKGSPRVDAFEVQVPAVSVKRLHDALAANPTARERLVGGSVTVEGQRLILVAELSDLSLVRTFVGELGGTWSDRAIQYGDREFVAA